MFLKKTIIELLTVILILSLLFFIYSFFIVLTAGGNFGMYSKIASQVLAQKYSSLMLTSFFTCVSSIVILLLIVRLDRKTYSLSLINPLLGYFSYSTMVSIYFYDQIYNKSNLINQLLSFADVNFPLGSHGLWTSKQLLETRIIQTFMTGFLVFYGFFTANLFSLYEKNLRLKDVISITVLLIMFLFFINKILDIKLHQPIVGVAIHVISLFLLPFLFSILIAKKPATFW